AAEAARVGAPQLFQIEFEERLALRSARGEALRLDDTRDLCARQTRQCLLERSRRPLSDLDQEPGTGFGIQVRAPRIKPRPGFSGGFRRLETDLGEVELESELAGEGHLGRRDRQPAL